MAITISTAMTDSFKKEILMGTHQFKASAGHTFKMALLGAAASATVTIGTATTNYSAVTGASAEATDTTYTTGGYVAGGFTMTANADPTVSSNVAYIDWNTDPTWGTAASIISCGALLYNSTAGGNSVASFTFGGDKSSTSGSFTLTLPAPGSATAILRIA